MLKSTVPDALDAVGNGDACKTAATIKSPIPDARNTVGDGDVCKPVATRKSTTSDARNAVGNGDACKTATVPKSIIPNARNTTVSRNLTVFTSDHERSAFCFNQAVPVAVIDRIPLSHNELSN